LNVMKTIGTQSIIVSISKLFLDAMVQDIRCLVLADCSRMKAGSTGIQVSARHASKRTEINVEI
jgi:hypothetical protein